MTCRSSFGVRRSSPSRSRWCSRWRFRRSASADVWTDAKHGTVDNAGVKIHYATMGSGPVVVMIHGFPDFWYSWRHQMAALAGRYQVVAIDQRGYNLSDKPAGQAQYDMSLLVGDVRAVVQQLAKGQRAIIVGHDWGGMVAWRFAMQHPELTERLIVLNLPHPRGLAHELATQPAAAAEFGVRAPLPGAGRGENPDRRGPRQAGGRRDRPRALHRGVQAVRLRGDAQLLQAELPEVAVHGRHLAGRQGEGAGAPGARPERHGPAARCAEPHLGVDRQHAHPRHDSRRRPLRAERRPRPRVVDDELVACSFP